MTGGKPKVLGLIIPDPFDQVLLFSTNDMVLPDSLDFIVFFTINFQWWCFVIHSVALVAPQQTDVKNVVKTS